jgi:hypothetical protein
MRVPDRCLADLGQRGYLVFEGFLEADELAAAQESLWLHYPRPEEYFADPAAHAWLATDQWAGIGPRLERVLQRCPQRASSTPRWPTRISKRPGVRRRAVSARCAAVLVRYRLLPRSALTDFGTEMSLACCWLAGIALTVALVVGASSGGYRTPHVRVDGIHGNAAGRVRHGADAVCDRPAPKPRTPSALRNRVLLPACAR